MTIFGAFVAGALFMVGVAYFLHWLIKTHVEARHPASVCKALHQMDHECVESERRIAKMFEDSAMMQRRMTKLFIEAFEQIRAAAGDHNADWTVRGVVETVKRYVREHP